MTEKKAVGLWIRVSTEDQAKGESPQTHEKRGRLYAEAKEWEIRTVYHLEAMSGKTVMDYPETKRMLADIRSGYITGVIFSKLARLARNTKELLEFAEIFKKHGASLTSLQESIDTSTPGGMLFYTILGAVGQWEREETSSRVSSAVPIKAGEGKPVGGQASFGYKWENKKFIIDENEAPIRKLIYETFLKTRRKKTTAKELNEMGYRTRNGSKFSDTTIDRLIRDPSAKGERRANYTKSENDKKAWTLKPESEWVIVPCSAIVPTEIWNECNMILDEQLKKRKAPGRKAVHLLSGLMYCDCGKKMYVFNPRPSANPTYACTPCKRRIAVSDIDEIFQEQLRTFLLAETDISDYVSKTGEVVREKENQLAILSNESRTIHAQMQELVTMRMNKEMEPDTFMKFHKPLEERMRQIDERLPELQAEIDILKVNNLSTDVVLEEAKNLYDKWPHIPFEEKRIIVECITNKITIGKEDIAFTLSYIPSFLQNPINWQRNRMVALPFYKKPVQVRKPYRIKHPIELLTLGDHVRKKRIESSLLQKDVATIFKVCEDTITGWESGRTKPEVRYYPAIVRFLGYSPFELPDDTLAKQVKHYRYQHGLTPREFGKLVSVDASTVRAWELSLSVPKLKSQNRLTELILKPS